VKVLNDQQLELEQRFIAAYNSIDKHMRKTVGLGPSIGFAKVARSFCASKWPQGTEQLLALASLRNAVVHAEKGHDRPFFLPSPAAVDEIEDVMRRVLTPDTVLQHFQRTVSALRHSDSIDSALDQIRANDYSQFPVYKNGRFAGLLTENGITRWLAQHVHEKLSLVDFGEEQAETVLIQEAKRRNCEFVAGSTTIEKLVAMFSINLELEAVLITEHGKRSEPLQGIATTWDIIALKRVDRIEHIKAPKGKSA